MGISVGNPDEVYNLIADYIEPAPNTPYGSELTYIRTVMQNTKVYFDVIKEAATMGQNLTSLYPAQGINSLADQLRIVGKLINGGLTTSVYQVSIGGNASYGTDHGAAAPLFVFGKGVNPGIIGANPVIPQNLQVSGDVAMQHDFRSVYASVLQDWFDLDNGSSILNGSFPILPIFKGSVDVKDTPSRNVFEVGNYPNPVHASSTITFTIPSAYVSITLLDAQGRNIRKIAEGNYPAGVHNVTFNRDGLPSGSYYYVLRINGLGVTKKMLIL